MKAEFKRVYTEDIDGKGTALAHRIYEGKEGNEYAVLIGGYKNDIEKKDEQFENRYCKIAEALADKGYTAVVTSNPSKGPNILGHVMRIVKAYSHDNSFEKPCLNIIGHSAGALQVVWYMHKYSEDYIVEKVILSGIPLQLKSIGTTLAGIDIICKIAKQVIVIYGEQDLNMEHIDLLDTYLSKYSNFSIDVVDNQDHSFHNGQKGFYFDMIMEHMLEGGVTCVNSMK